jgi:hypothetical protein
MLKMQHRTRYGLGAFLIAAFVIAIAIPQTANAQFTVNITIDENGHGQFSNSSGFMSALPFTLQTDPGPGGLAGALTYDLLNPPGQTAGDLVLLENGGLVSDIIRFNPSETCSGTTGCLVFYSDNFDGVDSLADIGFPTASYTNILTVNEVGPEGNNGFTYTPMAGQPGFVAGAGGPVTYVIQSDSSVPEPSSILLLGIGLGAVIFVCRKRVGRALPLGSVKGRSVDE